MIVDYHPRRFLEDRLKTGWQLIPDHDYSPGDYAIVMQWTPDFRVPSRFQIARMMKPFLPGRRRKQPPELAKSRLPKREVA